MEGGSTAGASAILPTASVPRIQASATFAVRGLQLQVEAKCVVEVGHDVGGGSSDDGAEALDCDGADLLGLGLGVLPEAGRGCGQEGLEGEDPVGVAGDRHHGDNSAAETSRGRVRPVIADDHRRTTTVGLAPTNGLQIDEPDLTAQHQRSIPSAAVVSHAD